MSAVRAVRLTALVRTVLARLPSRLVSTEAATGPVLKSSMVPTILLVISGVSGLVSITCGAFSFGVLYGSELARLERLTSKVEERFAGESDNGNKTATTSEAEVDTKNAGTKETIT